MLFATGVYFGYQALNSSFFPESSKAETPGPHWENFSEQQMVDAKAAGKGVIIDFWATWCLSCLELEKYTFSHPIVLEKASDFVFLKVDATKETPRISELIKRFEVIGLPSVIFFDKQGKWRKDLTLTGFEGAEKFSKRMSDAL